MVILHNWSDFVGRFCTVPNAQCIVGQIQVQKSSSYTKRV